MAPSLRLFALAFYAREAVVWANLVVDFRPPATPLVVTSPFLSVWSPSDTLYGADTMHWSGAESNMRGMVQVDSQPAAAWMGAIPIPAVIQIGRPLVYATQTQYSFAVHGVFLNVTFTTPLVPPPSPAGPGPDLFSLPVSYITWTAASSDGVGHSVKVYVDWDATLVTNNSYAHTTPVAWETVLTPNSTSSISGKRIGAASQWPLDPVVCGQSQPLTGSQTIVWGWLYGLCSGCSGSYAGSSNASRASFISGQGLPPDDPSSPSPVGPTFPGLAFGWTASTAPGTGAAATGYVTLFMDEILSHNYSFDGVEPVIMAPLWRVKADLPFNDTIGVPIESLLLAHGQHDVALQACDAWDALIVSDMLHAATGPDGAPNATEGSLSQATLASLVYRQVLGHHALAWHPGQERLWYFLKEIASGGDDSTMDVIYPSSPLLLSYAPHLLASLLIPIMEASSPDAYRKAWVVHDLGKFPIADRSWGGQEDMPVEETANLMLMVAGIGYQNGSNLDLFRPYYEAPGGFARWAAFLNASLPFPDRQGTTDDFLGSTANGTNLVIKGCAGLGAWGYIQWVYGNTSGAVASWTAAGSCGAALAKYGWYTPPPPLPGHFAWSYGLQSTPSSFFCLYNFLYVRLLRMENLLPNQTMYLSEQAQYFALGGQVGERFGVPLINGSDGMKLDWNSFLATSLYDPPDPPRVPVLPLPSAFSSSVFVAMLAGANASNMRVPMTDFFSAKDATYGGKYRGRPVMGGVWAPVALAKLSALAPMAHELPMAQAFQQGHDKFSKGMA